MKKLVGVLAIVIVVMGIVSGFLFYQLSEMQSQNSELSSQNAEIQNQLEEAQNNNNQLENQITELQEQNSQLINQSETYQNQIEQLEGEILGLEREISELESQLSKYTNFVKITEVVIEPGFNPYIALTMLNKVNVTIENLGVNDVEDLVLTIEHSSPSVGDPYSLEVLCSGEKREVTGNLFWVVGTTGSVTVTLKLDEVIIDEYIIPNFPDTQ